jgi:hypothetical protein
MNELTSIVFGAQCWISPADSLRKPWPIAAYFHHLFPMAHISDVYQTPVLQKACKTSSPLPSGEGGVQRFSCALYFFACPCELCLPCWLHDLQGRYDVDARMLDCHNDVKRQGTEGFRQSGSSRIFDVLYNIFLKGKTIHNRLPLCRLSIPSNAHHYKKLRRFLYSPSPKIDLNRSVLDCPYQHLHAGQSPTVPTVRGHLLPNNTTNLCQWVFIKTIQVVEKLWKTMEKYLRVCGENVECHVEKSTQIVDKLLRIWIQNGLGLFFWPSCGENRKLSTIFSTTPKIVDKSGRSPFKDSWAGPIPTTLSPVSTTPTTTATSRYI